MTAKLKTATKEDNKQINLKKPLILAILFGLSVSLLTPLALMAKNGQNKLNSAYLSQKEFEKLVNKEHILRSARDIRPYSAEKNQDRPNSVIYAVITAYTSTPDQTDDSPFIAATGKRVYDGMIAANGLPFGTKIKLPEIYGDKVFTVDDRMNSRYGLGRMDVWLDADRRTAINFGVKYTKAEIYYPNYRLTRL